MDDFLVVVIPVQSSVVVAATAVVAVGRDLSVRVVPVSNDCGEAAVVERVVLVVLIHWSIHVPFDESMLQYYSSLLVLPNLHPFPYWEEAAGAADELQVLYPLLFVVPMVVLGSSQHHPNVNVSSLLYHFDLGRVVEIVLPSD
jgi:hypothetical protein